jgi:hypothetical protein
MQEEAMNLSELFYRFAEVRQSVLTHTQTKKSCFIEMMN